MILIFYLNFLFKKKLIYKILIFKSPIITGKENLTLEIYGDVSQSNKELICKLIINLDDLKDQLKKQGWHKLYLKNGSTENGQILLSLQWIHSRVKYLNDILKTWEENILETKNDQISFQQNINHIYELFNSAPILAYSTDKSKYIKLSKT